MKLNSVERVAMNNPVRAAHQHTREAGWFRRLAGDELAGRHVLEVGCGRGVGVEILLDRFDAARVTAFDLDPGMIEKAERRLRGRGAARVDLSVGDICAIEQPSSSVDAVVDFGIIHHVPTWRSALAEVARVLRPGGLLLFEEIPRHVLDTWVVRTFTDHPRDDRFEADEFVEELARHGLHGVGHVQHRFGSSIFVGAARKTRAATTPATGRPAPGR